MGTQEQGEEFDLETDNANLDRHRVRNLVGILISVAVVILLLLILAAEAMPPLLGGKDVLENGTLVSIAFVFIAYVIIILPGGLRAFSPGVRRIRMQGEVIELTFPSKTFRLSWNSPDLAFELADRTDDRSGMGPKYSLYFRGGGSALSDHAFHSMLDVATAKGLIQESHTGEPWHKMVLGRPKIYTIRGARPGPLQTHGVDDRASV